MSGWNNFAKISDESQKIRADKRILKMISRVKTWQLIIILAVFVLLTAMFLRLNNLGMVNLRDALAKSDETGDIQKVETAATNLQNFVANHMNTSTGKLPLQTLYNQAARQAIAASKPPEINAEAYTTAQNSCMPQLQNYGYKAWAQCVASSVGISDVNSLNQNQQAPPDPDAFYVEFASARWSLDPAGILLFISVILVLIIIFRAIFAVILRIILLVRSRKLRSL
jgi:hypothetical protein